MVKRGNPVLLMVQENNLSLNRFRAVIVTDSQDTQAVPTIKFFRVINSGESAV